MAQSPLTESRLRQQIEDLKVRHQQELAQEYSQLVAAHADADQLRKQLADARAQDEKASRDAASALFEISALKQQQQADDLVVAQMRKEQQKKDAQHQMEMAGAQEQIAALKQALNEQIQAEIQGGDAENRICDDSWQMLLDERT